MRKEIYKKADIADYNGCMNIFGKQCCINTACIGNPACHNAEKEIYIYPVLRSFGLAPDKSIYKGRQANEKTCQIEGRFIKK